MSKNANAKKYGVYVKENWGGSRRLGTIKGRTDEIALSNARSKFKRDDIHVIKQKV